MCTVIARDVKIMWHIAIFVVIFEFTRAVCFQNGKSQSNTGRICMIWTVVATLAVIGLAIGCIVLGTRARDGSVAGMSPY